MPIQNVFHFQIFKLTRFGVEKRTKEHKKNIIAILMIRWVRPSPSFCLHLKYSVISYKKALMPVLSRSCGKNGQNCSLNSFRKYMAKRIREKKLNLSQSAGTQEVTFYSTTKTKKGCLN